MKNRVSLREYLDELYKQEAEHLAQADIIRGKIAKILKGKLRIEDVIGLTLQDVYEKAEDGDMFLGTSDVEGWESFEIAVLKSDYLEEPIVWINLLTLPDWVKQQDCEYYILEEGPTSATYEYIGNNLETRLSWEHVIAETFYLDEPLDITVSEE